MTEFSTQTRIHIAIPVRNIEASVAFYRELFAQEPTKLREDYAKFEVADPPVNYTLNQDASAKAPPSPQHYGIQMKTTDEVGAFSKRMEAAGLPSRAEDNVTCCYAVMDKIWLADPDGHAWEIFAVTDADAAVHSLPGATMAGPAADEAASDAEPDAPCCAPTCCT